VSAMMYRTSPGPLPRGLKREIAHIQPLQVA
jgi:hypothetical protein